MADEKRVSLLVEGKAKGLADIDKGIAGIGQAAVKAGDLQTAMYDDVAKKLEKATARVRDLTQALEKQAKGVRPLEDVLKLAKATKSVEALEKRFKKMGEAMAHSVDGGAKHVQDDLKKVEKHAKAAGDAIEHMHRKHGQGGGGGGHGAGGGHGGGGHQHKHSFLQGFLEGALPGHLSRIIEHDKPGGMMRQAGGIVAGESLKEGIGGIASIPYAGEAGLAKAMESVPLVGGALGAMTERSMGQAKQAIAFRRQESSLAPYLGGIGTRHGAAVEAANRREYARAGVTDEQVEGQVSGARARGAASFDPHAVGPQSDRLMQDAKRRRQDDLDAYAQGIGRKRGVAADSEEAKSEAAKMLGVKRSSYVGMSRKFEAYEPVSDKYIERAAAPMRAQAGDDAASAAQRAADDKRALARQDVYKRTVAPVAHAGAEYGGMDLGETQQYIARVAQAGGGTGRDVQGQGMLGFGIAAQTAYGIGPETTGAFMQAGRVGGVAGKGLGGGRTTDNGQQAMLKSMNDGIRMGLEGSELTKYMQQMAQSIQGWTTTGIPLAQESIGRLGGSLSTAGGMGGQRAALASQNVAASLQNLGKEGVQDSAGALQMQIFGGYKGGGFADYWKAKQQLEEGGDPKKIEAQLKEYSTTLLQSGGGQDLTGKSSEEDKTKGAATLQGGLSRLGINLSGKESDLYLRQLTGSTTAEDDKGIKQLQAKMTRRRETAESVQEKGAGETGAVNREEAEKRNRELASGDKFIKTVQSMDEIMQSSTEAFSKLAGTMNDFSEAMKHAVEWITHGGGGGHGGGEKATHGVAHASARAAHSKS